MGPASSPVLFDLLDASAKTWSVILVSMVLGLGMANIMAPATDSIMGSLPPEKAGVGSAMNDTTREIGGALGVAIMGSITSAVYTTRINGDAAFKTNPIAADSRSQFARSVCKYFFPDFVKE